MKPEDTRHLERVIEHMNRIGPEGDAVPDDWPEAIDWNAKRLSYLLDEIVRAKYAKRHVLAGEIAALYNEVSHQFFHLVIATVPTYEMKQHIAESTDSINPDNN